MKKISSLIASLSVLAGFAFASSAHADNKYPCVITSLQHDGSRLVLSCESDATLYYAFQNTTGCASNSADNMKVWASFLQTAMLSSMPVELWYARATTSCNVPQIQMVKMYKQ